MPKYLPRSNPPCQVIADFYDPSLILDDPRSQRFILYRFTRQNGTIGFVVGSLFKDAKAQEEDQEVDLSDILRHVTPQELQRYEHEDWKQEIDREANRRKPGRPKKQSRSPKNSSIEAELPLAVKNGLKTRRRRSRKRSLDQTGFLVVAHAQHPTSETIPQGPGRPERIENARPALSQDTVLLSDTPHHRPGALNARPLPISPIKGSSRNQSSRSRLISLSTETPPRALYSMVQTALSETKSESPGANDSRNRSERAMSSKDKNEAELTLIPSSNQRSLLTKGVKSMSSTSNSETEQVTVKSTQLRKESIDPALPDHRSPDPDEDPSNTGRDLLGQFRATNMRRLPRREDSSVILKQFQATQVRSLAERPQSNSGDSDKLPSQPSSPASWSTSNLLPNSTRKPLQPQASPPQPQLKRPPKASFGGSSGLTSAGTSSLFASRSTQTLEPCKQKSSPPRHQNLSPSGPNSMALPTTSLEQRELRKSITPHFPSAGILKRDGNFEPSYSSPFKSRGIHKKKSSTARSLLRKRRSLVTYAQHELRKSITPQFPSAGRINKDGSIEPHYGSSLKSGSDIRSHAARSPLRQRRSSVTDKLELKQYIPDQADSHHAARAPPASTLASGVHSGRSQHAVKEDQQAAVRKKRSPRAAAPKISSKSALGSASGSSIRANSKHLPHKDRRPVHLRDKRGEPRPAPSKPDPISGLSSSSASSHEKLEDEELWRRELILPYESSDDEG